MPHKEPRVRVERGLYKGGATYYATATPPGGKRPRWKSLGKVNLSRARDLRDAFVTEVRGGNAPPPAAGNANRFERIADEGWLTNNVS